MATVGPAQIDDGAFAVGNHNARVADRNGRATGRLQSKCPPVGPGTSLITMPFLAERLQGDPWPCAGGTVRASAGTSAALPQKPADPDRVSRVSLLKFNPDASADWRYCVHTHVDAGHWNTRHGPAGRAGH